MASWGGFGLLALPEEDGVCAENQWTAPIPAGRGAQKKAALRRQEEDPKKKKSKGKGKGKDSGRTLPHAKYGLLRVTLGSAKSYIVCTEPPPSEPKFLVELNKSQCGDNHGSLILSLARIASTKQLSREEMRELKATILAQLKGPSKTYKSHPPRRKQQHHHPKPYGFLKDEGLWKLGAVTHV